MSDISLLFDTKAVPVNQVGGCGTQKQFSVIPFIIFLNVAVDLWSPDLFLELVPK